MKTLSMDKISSELHVDESAHSWEAAVQLTQGGSVMTDIESYVFAMHAVNITDPRRSQEDVAAAYKVIDEKFCDSDKEPFGIVDHSDRAIHLVGRIGGKPRYVLEYADHPSKPLLFGKILLSLSHVWVTEGWFEGSDDTTGLYQGHEESRRTGPLNAMAAMQRRSWTDILLVHSVRFNHDIVRSPIALDLNFDWGSDKLGAYQVGWQNIAATGSHDPVFAGRMAEIKREFESIESA